MMGASKRIMEFFLNRRSVEMPVSTARFANVAFSDGSLLYGFNRRLDKNQPLSAPNDVRRYFVTPKEAGQLCVMSCLLGENRDVFFPKLDHDLNLVTFSSIAEKYLRNLGYPKDESKTIAFQVLAFLDTEAIGGCFVTVYSFNYTRVQLNGRAPDAAIIHYMHGSCSDGKIIIGTRDDKEYDTNYDFLQKSFDPSFNPPALVADLQDADEVIIFGHSIGENDRQYFKAFFTQQTSYTNTRRKDITIFTRNSDSELQIKRSLQGMTDGNLSTLFGLNNLQIIKTGELEEDQRKLYDFLVKHGKGEMPTREFIGSILSKQK
jgi:hypothetical protein